MQPNYSALRCGAMRVRACVRACARLKTLAENTQRHHHPLLFLAELDETYRVPSEGREQQSVNHCPGRSKDYVTRRNATSVLFGRLEWKRFLRVTVN